MHLVHIGCSPAYLTELVTATSPSCYLNTLDRHIESWNWNPNFRISYNIAERVYTRYEANNDTYKTATIIWLPTAIVYYSLI